MLFNWRNKAIKFYDDYFSMILKAKKTGCWTRWNRTWNINTKTNASTITIVLGQVKAGNNSESLINEIRQILYSLYQSKQITEKVYNELIEPIQ